MKKIFILATGIALAFTACKPDTNGELGSPANKLEGMAGTWEITSFKQQDPNNPIREERDLSEFYIMDGQVPYRVTFNSDSMTYSVAAGPGKNYFGSGGRWAFDNAEYPIRQRIRCKPCLVVLCVRRIANSTLNSKTTAKPQTAAARQRLFTRSPLTA